MKIEKIKKNKGKLNVCFMMYLYHVQQYCFKSLGNDLTESSVSDKTYFCDNILPSSLNWITFQNQKLIALLKPKLYFLIPFHTFGRQRNLHFSICCDYALMKNLRTSKPIVVLCVPRITKWQSSIQRFLCFTIIKGKKKTKFTGF